jgi:hypothetical protein
VGALRARCDLAGAGPFAVGESAVMIYTMQPARPGCG